MSLSLQGTTLFTLVYFMSGNFTRHSVTLTQLVPTKTEVEPTTFHAEFQQEQPMRKNYSILHSKPSPIVAGYSMVRTFIPTSTSTPSLLDSKFNVTQEDMRPRTIPFQPHHSTSSIPIPNNIESSRSSISSFSGKISKLKMSPSRINPSGWAIDCPKRCRCKQCRQDGKIREDMVELKCKAKNLKRFLSNFKISKRKICSLNLAENNISFLWKNAFQGFENLQSLNLDYNKLRVLHQKMLLGLPSLHYLSLRYNNLRKWKGNILDLPRIKVLNLEGNKKFSSARTLFKNTTLAAIFGLSFSKQCQNCNMTRKIASWNSVIEGKGCTYLPQNYYPMAEELLSRFLLFKGKCEKENWCQISFTSTSKIKRVYKNKCWEAVKMLRPVVILLGILAVLFNAIVVMVIITTKALRSSTALLLISHMSFCDILIGVYAIAVGDGHGVVENSDSEFGHWRINLCPYYRTIFVFGQFMEVATSLLVTTERHFAIVFCMNPSLRVKKKHSALLLLFFWILAAILSSMLHAFDGSTITDNFMCILVRDLKNHGGTDFFYSQGTMILLVGIYLVIVLEYCHIYIFVRRTSISAGVRRETKLASRICVMVFTSFVFFAVPNILMIVKTVGSISLPLTAVQGTIIAKWLPPVFLVFNACLNPILFAYRNDKFMNSIKERIKGLRRIRIVRSRVRSRGDQPGQVHAENNSQVHLNIMMMMELTSPRPSYCNRRVNENRAMYSYN